MPDTAFADLKPEPGARQVAVNISLLPGPDAPEGADPQVVQIIGQTTGNPHLVITPRTHRDGTLVGDFAVTHVPTGRALTVGDLQDMRLAAEAVRDMDWDFTDIEALRGTAFGADVLLRLREAPFHRPTAVEMPAHDAWGKDGKGRGQARSAAGKVEQFLADAYTTYWQVMATSGKAPLVDEHGCEFPPIPIDVPDPDAPSGRSPNPVWLPNLVRAGVEFQATYLLALLHRLDPAIADSAAAWLADIMEHGDSAMGEYLYHWRAQLARGERMDLPATPADAPPAGCMFTPDTVTA